MRQIGPRPPAVDSQARADELKTLRKTLRVHYQRKRAHYGVDKDDFHDRALRRLFSGAPQYASPPPAARSRNGVPGAPHGADADLPPQRPPPAAPVSSGSTSTAATRRARGKDNVKPRRKLRVGVLVHPELGPPETVSGSGEELEKAPWKTEHDVLRTLAELGHEAVPVPVGDELGRIRATLFGHKPHIVFNLLEGFADIPSFDYNVVAYLELLRVRYTGCNSRGLFLARDKAVCKQILSYHRLPVPAFAIIPKGKRVRRPRRLEFPLIVKGLTLDASV